MQYLKPYTFFLNKPNGSKNLLWGFLCYLSSFVIPLIGPLVWMGYIVDCIRTLKQDPNIEDHPDFDPNKFAEYLGLGIWPLAMNLVVGLFFFFIIMIVTAVAFGVGYATKEPLIGIAILVVGYFPLLFGMAFITWPMNLHSQLRSSLELGEAIRFTIRFLKLVGGQSFISLIVHFFIANLLAIAGLLLCFIGVYAAMAVITMAQEHYMIQLYRLYLDEGGEPIPEPEVKEKKKKRNEEDQFEIEN
jgi:hypothetical protein